MSDAVPVKEVLRQLSHEQLVRFRGTYSDEERDEARSEFLLRLVDGRLRWRGDAPAQAWARICVEALARNIRRNRRRRHRIEEPASDGAAWAASSTAARQDLEAERHLLERLAVRLPPRHQQALQLYLAGHTSEEMAAHLGCTADAAYGLASQACEWLRRLEADTREAVHQLGSAAARDAALARLASDVCGQTVPRLLAVLLDGYWRTSSELAELSGISYPMARAQSQRDLLPLLERAESTHPWRYRLPEAVRARLPAHIFARAGADDGLGTRGGLSPSGSFDVEETCL